MPPAYLRGPEVDFSRGDWMACDGKERFVHPGLALTAAARLDGRKHYRCLDCGYWHVSGRTEQPMAADWRKRTRTHLEHATAMALKAR